MPEFQVSPDPARLLSTGVTVTELLEAIRRTNVIDSPGLLEHDHQLVLGLVSGQVRTPEQIGKIVVKNTPVGVPVRIGDVATVGPSVGPVYTIVTANGKSAVLLSINRQPESNTLAVADEVHAQIEELAATLPPGVHLEPFYDQSTIVHDSIASVRDAVLLGLILSSAILVLFLRDWGTSLVAGLVIPATLLLTFIVLKFTGQSFNLMTLGGLAAAVGLVIDDAIVVLENIVLHRDAGEGRAQAIQSALRENHNPADWFHYHPDCCIPAFGVDHGSHWKFFPCACHHDDRFLTVLVSARSGVDAYPKPIFCPQKEFRDRFVTIR